VPQPSRCGFRTVRLAVRSHSEATPVANWPCMPGNGRARVIGHALIQVAVASKRHLRSEFRLYHISSPRCSTAQARHIIRPRSKGSPLARSNRRGASGKLKCHPQGCPRSRGKPICGQTVVQGMSRERVAPGLRQTKIGPMRTADDESPRFLSSWIVPARRNSGLHITTPAVADREMLHGFDHP